jgi:N-acetylglucosamine kinase-like BadF-type ATPase
VIPNHHATEAAEAASTLILGVDAGGTKTCAALASVNESRQIRVLGRGLSGPANPRTTSLHTAQSHILEAIQSALVAGQRHSTSVDAICLGIAGTGHPSTRAAMEQWCEQQHLAARWQVVHDAHIILRAGSSTGVGIALISGTGSLAYGCDANGVAARSGGWGHLWGDEGSAFAMGAAALRAITQAADGRGSATRLVEAILRHAGAESPADLVPAFLAGQDSRQRIAALAPLVFRAAVEGDAMAQRITSQAASDLADMVRSVVRALSFTAGDYSLVFAGGVLVQQAVLRESVATRLAQESLRPGCTSVVVDPVIGALRLAAEL